MLLFGLLQIKMKIYVDVFVNELSFEQGRERESHRESILSAELLLEWISTLMKLNIEMFACAFASSMRSLENDCVVKIECLFLSLSLWHWIN